MALQNIIDDLDAGGSCLVLLLRHIGDATISSGMINALQDRYPAITIDILGRPGLEEVLAAFTQFREYFSISLPVFGHHRRDRVALAHAFKTMRQIRRRKYAFCLNFIGDVRENLLGSLIGARTTIAPCWESGHLFKQKMSDTGARYFADCSVWIPASYTGYYASMQFFAEQLGLDGLRWSQRAKRPTGKRIAIHPGASHPSRHWPPVKWRALVQELARRGFHLVVIGATQEHDLLTETFGESATSVQLDIVAGDIERTKHCLATADLLIGMDSYSVHAAYSLGVPAVVLNGSSDVRVMAPPGSEPVSAGHLCKSFPCNYSYPCQGKADEYICCRGIEVEDVLAAVDTILMKAVQKT